MRRSKLWKKLLGVEHVVLEDGNVEVVRGGEVLVFAVRPDHGHRRRCSRCGRRCRYHDAGEGRRRWRALDAGTMRCYLEADAPRVACPVHGVVVAAVPWARQPASRFTTAFEDQAAWLCAAMTTTKAAQLLRTTWRSLQAIIERVVADLAGKTDRLAGLTRIGIDELSYRKGQRYIMVVVDHDSGRLVWAGERRCQDTVRKFFDDLGPERAALLAEVSADGAEWIHDVIRERAPAARICLDSYHVVAWANEALNKVRCRLAAELRATGQAELADTRWAVLKKPQDLTTGQRTTIAALAAINSPLYKAYLIKEQLREIYRAGPERGKILLAGLLSWCARCRIPEFVALGKTLRRFRDLIWNTLETGTTNAKTEATNTHLRALTKRAYGFHSPGALIAMASLTRGGLCPPLPGR